MRKVYCWSREQWQKAKGGGGYMYLPPLGECIKESRACSLFMVCLISQSFVSAMTRGTMALFTPDYPAHAAQVDNKTFPPRQWPHPSGRGVITWFTRGHGHHAVTHQHRVHPNTRSHRRGLQARQATIHSLFIRPPTCPAVYATAHGPAALSTH